MDIEESSSSMELLPLLRVYYETLFHQTAIDTFAVFRLSDVCRSSGFRSRCCDKPSPTSTTAQEKQPPTMASLIRSARHLSKFHPAAAVTIGHQPIGVSVCGTTPHERGYVTRAHATPLPTTPIEDALQTLLSEMDDRHVHRQKRWENNKEKRVAQRASYLGQKGKPAHPSEEEVKAEASSSPYRGMDETISLALQLNLDPRKPGQSLRGSLSLPHGNGKKFSVAVFR